MILRRVSALALLLALAGCASSDKEPQQTEQSLSAQSTKVDVEETTKQNKAKVAEMSAGAASRTTNFKFYNRTGYRVYMYAQTVYGKWEGEISAYNETIWQSLPHDGTFWAWAYGYDSSGNQVVYWSSKAYYVSPGVEYFEFSWNP